MYIVQIKAWLNICRFELLLNSRLFYIKIIERNLTFSLEVHLRIANVYMYMFFTQLHCNDKITNEEK